MKALSPAAGERYPSAVEFADALEAAAARAGLAVAKPRDVAAEVQSLDVPQPQIDAAKLPAPKGGSASGVSKGSSGVVASTPAPSRAGGRRWMLAVGAGAAIVLGLSLFLALRSGESAPAAAVPLHSTVVTPAVTSTPAPEPARTAEPKP